MPFANLRLFSEPFSPSGNLAADGYRKLLGTPALDLLQTVVRESVQNSCDAAKSGVGPEVHFRLRRLDTLQLSKLRECVFAELPSSAASTEPLANFLKASAPYVLEICDFGTTGLAGPTRADVVNDGEHSDFVNFLRNVGSPRDTHQGGGTYGYGKTSLYLSSRCSTILVDSQTTHQRKPIRRMMACHLGGAHKAGPPKNERRYTGRHWWGLRHETEHFVEPLEGENCDSLAAEVGFPHRSAMSTGTSIMILDPIFMDEDPSTLMRRVQEALLWWFWPRMLETTEPNRRVRFVTEVDGIRLPIPAPETFPPIHLFAEALNVIRAGAAEINMIRCERPKKDLGQLVIRKGLHAPRRRLVEPAQSLIPERAFSIAVMRPVELVVRYFEGEPLPDPTVEWAGVFVTSSEPFVENAFASSEPPAHDDWQPSLMAKGPQRTFVSVALQRIKETARALGPATAALHSVDQAGPSLARTAQTLGQILRGSDNSDIEVDRSTGKRSGRRQPFASRPKFERLEMRGTQVAAIFSITLKPGKRLGAITRLHAVAGIVIDGAPTISHMDLDMPSPPILDWRSSDGVVIGEGLAIELVAAPGTIEVSVGIIGDCAIGLIIEVQGVEAA